MEIPVGRFELSITAKEPIIVPPYKGSTLRGGFGNAFKKVVCALKSKECPECLLKEKCVYYYIFETPPMPGTKVMRKYESVPHPFVIEPPPERKMGYKPGEGFTFGLILVGKAIDYLPYFIYTFDELGRIGIGKGRGKFDLNEVRSQDQDVNSEGRGEDTHDVIYSSHTKVLKAFSPTPLYIETNLQAPNNPPTESLTLNFITPTRIYYNGHLTLELEFHILIRQLLRRIALLSYFHCGIDTTQWDFKGIIGRSKWVMVKERNLRWYGWERYSGRQDRRINMGGFVGQISFEGPVAPFRCLIKAGEMLHVGKGTAFGLGKINSGIVK